MGRGTADTEQLCCPGSGENRNVILGNAYAINEDYGRHHVTRLSRRPDSRAMPIPEEKQDLMAPFPQDQWRCLPF
jgi:hypothetical protein